MEDIKGFGPQITEPTEEQIKQAIEKVKEKYGIELSQADASNYIKLTEELGWWLTIEKKYDSENCITEEIAKEIQVFIKESKGKNISLEQAYLEAEKSLIITMNSEKERIANEIRTIVNKKI